MKKNAALREFKKLKSSNMDKRTNKVAEELNEKECSTKGI